MTEYLNVIYKEELQENKTHELLCNLHYRQNGYCTKSNNPLVWFYKLPYISDELKIKLSEDKNIRDWSYKEWQEPKSQDVSFTAEQDGMFITVSTNGKERGITYIKKGDFVQVAFGANADQIQEKLNKEDQEFKKRSKQNA